MCKIFPELIPNFNRPEGLSCVKLDEEDIFYYK
jgi:hypothetical protein